MPHSVTASAESSGHTAQAETANSDLGVVWFGEDLPTAV
ncbi:Unknown protein sequence [Pseudomonas coronafaciens pv. oryzae]|nr:Unknown protein sequence [Pseudomonas coronafaciens pv. oryzae]